MEEFILTCLSLPFSGIKKLEGQELLRFKGERNVYRNWLMFSVLLMVLSFSIFVYACKKAPVSDEMISISLIAFLLVLPISFFKFVSVLNRYLIFYKTIKKGGVRTFEGEFTEDWTDDDFEHLMNGCIHKEGKNKIELFNGYDFIYTINGVRVKKWTELGTRKVPKHPAESSYYSLPKEWEAADGIALLRRRLTDSEKKEIKSYTVEIRRSRWKSMFWISILCINLTRVIVEYIFKIKEDGALFIYFGVTVIVCAVFFVRATRKAQKFESEIEFGWVLKYDPKQSQNKLTRSREINGKKDETEVNVDVELLPISEIEWIIDGRPAGWRRILE